MLFFKLAPQLFCKRFRPTTPIDQSGGPRARTQHAELEENVECGAWNVVTIIGSRERPPLVPILVPWLQKLRPTKCFSIKRRHWQIAYFPRHQCLHRHRHYHPPTVGIHGQESI